MSNITDVTAGSRVSPPSEDLLTVYVYYSYVTLGLSWLISPFLGYVIFTQSKLLKTFKWLIFNYCFWCLVLETLLTSIQPVFLSPASGGFALGILKSFGSHKAAGFMTAACFALSANCISALSATLISRYLVIFPSRSTRWFTVKAGFAIALGWPLFAYFLLFLTFYPAIGLMKGTDFRDAANRYDPAIATYFDKETFFYMPHEYHDFPDLIVIIIFILLFIISFAVIAFLSYKVKTRKSKLPIAMKQSLLKSSIAQIIITCIFLFLPNFSYFFVVHFDIPHSANFMCVMMCFLSSHSILQFLTILVFVLPYRKLIIKICRGKLGRKKEAQPVQVSPAESNK